MAVPLIDKLRSLSPGARDLLKKSVPGAPRFVVYSDAWVNGLPPVSDIQGFNVFALSFWRISGVTDMALQWQQFTSSQRAGYLSEYNGAGIQIIVSAFGDTEKPTTWNTDPIVVANNLASWVLQYWVNGVDIDYEDLDAFNNGHGAGEQWLITLTQQLRKSLPQGEFILSHAPVAPWFSPNIWGGGGYLHVHQTVGNLIDWYNIQFYNRKGNVRVHDLAKVSSSSLRPNGLKPHFIKSQLMAVDHNKLVIGKPGRSEDVTNGYVTVWKLHYCVQLAHATGWDAGVMAWEYPYTPTWWIETVRGGVI
ncbi:glycoside hydrolase family 18 protein [Boletus edulis]|nr:glycoside hydrolase family 18 protein [Boletus edulis]